MQAKPASTPSVVFVDPHTPAGVLCPDCAGLEPKPPLRARWLVGETHGTCSRCSVRLWPEITPYGVLDRAMAPLWVRFCERMGNPTPIRLAAEAAREERPLHWASVTAVYGWIEGRLLFSDTPQETRWLRALHHEVRRSHSAVGAPLVCSVPRAFGSSGEPIVVLSAPPKAQEIRCKVHDFIRADLGLL